EQRHDQTDADAPWRQEGSQPPLYYTIAALVTAPFDSSNWREIRRLNPHSDMGRPTRDGNANAVLHTVAEEFPWTRASLAVHVARLGSVLFSTLTVFFAYLVARECFPPTDDEGRRAWPEPSERANDRRGYSSSALHPSSPDQRAWLRLGAMVFTSFVPMF